MQKSEDKLWELSRLPPCMVQGGAQVGWHGSDDLCPLSRLFSPTMTFSLQPQSHAVLPFVYFDPGCPPPSIPSPPLDCTLALLIPFLLSCPASLFVFLSLTPSPSPPDACLLHSEINLSVFVPRSIICSRVDGVQADMGSAAASTDVQVLLCCTHWILDTYPG